MKRFGTAAALLLVLLALMMTVAAAEPMATGTDLGCDSLGSHFAYCTNPNVCYYCGQTVTDAMIRHTNYTEDYAIDDTYHERRCLGCGETEREAHEAFCDAPGVCIECKYVGDMDVWHDFTAYKVDAAGHIRCCYICGQTTGSWGPHFIICEQEEYTYCMACEAPYTGPVTHSPSDKGITGFNATQHWFTCWSCGKKITENHSPISGSEQGDTATCATCDQVYSLSAVANSGSSSSGRAPSTGSGIVSAGVASGGVQSVVAGDRVAAIRQGTLANWYGEELPMALVNAPKTGKATLRAAASADSKALATLKDGTIVVILDKGYRFTQVRVDGKTGYLLNGTLEKLDPDQLPIGEGMLVYPTTGGRGTTTINVRCEPSTKAAKVDQWPTGTMVLVWSISDNENWYEIEYEGVRGYVQAQFLTVTSLYDFTPVEETFEADAEEDTEAA